MISVNLNAYFGLISLILSVYILFYLIFRSKIHYSLIIFNYYYANLFVLEALTTTAFGFYCVFPYWSIFVVIALYVIFPAPVWILFAICYYKNQPIRSKSLYLAFCFFLCYGMSLSFGLIGDIGYFLVINPNIFYSAYWLYFSPIFPYIPINYIKELFVGVELIALAIFIRYAYRKALLKRNKKEVKK